MVLEDVLIMVFEALPVFIAIVACVYLSIQTPLFVANLWIRLGLGLGAVNCLLLVLLRLKWLQTYFMDQSYTTNILVINAWTIFNLSVLLSYILVAKGISCHRKKLEQ